jgi:hypothetical protein
VCSWRLPGSSPRWRLDHQHSKETQRKLILARKFLPDGMAEAQVIDPAPVDPDSR